MKGQATQMLGFLILSITVIAVILFMRTYLASSYGQGLSRISGRHEIEGFRAGTISILQTTDDTTDRTILELLGIAAYESTGSGDLDFGPGVGSVNALDEIEWRMNEIYGEGNWYVKIPYPDVIPRYQIIIIVDTSASLCDDFSDIATRLPDIINGLKNDGYNVAATIFTIMGGQDCCDGGSLDCTDLFGTSMGGSRLTRSYIHCENLERNDCAGSINGPVNNEDWGRGLACAIENEPYEGWYDFTAKIGIILSDELSTGSSDIQEITSDNIESLNVGIDYATGSNSHDAEVRVFPLKAKNCEWICAKNEGVEFDLYCNGCCINDANLLIHMEQIADATGGVVYTLDDATQASQSIREIITNHEFAIKPYIEVGTNPPENKNINSEAVPVTVPHIGGYTNIYIETWS
ncbi:MAG: hypothetical protein GF368_01695 [Candidatus Aenigmarchaeota archaeon]|nr:hypothetical protein [Candidatus Aenigmarchaeota archaeon]